MIKWRGKNLVSFSILATLFLAASLCARAGDSAEEDPLSESVVKAPDRNNPNHLLQFYTTAHKTKDIKMYEQTLHRDYVFVVDSGAAAFHSVPKGSGISRANDILAQVRIFSDPSIKSIQMWFLPLTD